MFKKIIIICLLICIGFLFSFQPASFKVLQLQNSRVKRAFDKKRPQLQALLASNNINKERFDLYIRVFKQENVLEAWVKNKNEKTFKLLKTFTVCATSGNSGPKRRQGDGQVPEGFYEISAFQPQSSYHLALRVSYPNKSDLLQATSADPGGDIMIHGNCVTIGCIPIEDEPIEELYVLAVEAKNTGGSLRTDIYPFKFSAQTLELMSTNATAKTLVLWNSLKVAFDSFELNHSLPFFMIDNKGNYHVGTK